ncbi:MAG: PilT protein domain-containing protein [Microgenomates group bacterium Gr01-1014_80]|nr:MAG: PilT protein domain-containing protein [Microgenomates group bacterium Gr01-1014_80]
MKPSTKPLKLSVNHMLRVVVDTVIFVRALLDPHSYSGRLLFEYSKNYRLFLSPPVIEEILEVLGRGEIIRRFHLRHNNYPEAMARLLKSMDTAEIILPSEIQSISRDPEDDKFLATAKAANADYLISADRDLLDLKEFDRIKIIDAETFLQILQEK